MASEASNYEITLKGHLDVDWGAWFDQFNVSQHTDRDGRPITMIAGFVPDQAALHGLLAKIRNIGATILSINPVISDEEETIE